MNYLSLTPLARTMARRRVLPSAFLLFEIAVAIFALGMCAAARGQPFWWMLLAGALPIARVAVDPTHRRSVANEVRNLWTSLSSTPANWPKRLLAAYLFATLPAALLYLSTHRTLGFGDSWPVVPAACSIACGRGGELSDYVAAAPSSYLQSSNDGLPYSVQPTPSGIYSRYPSGMLAFAVPAAIAARLAGADLEGGNLAKRLERLEKWAAVWVAALSVGFFFLIALRIADPWPAWCTTMLLASGSSHFSTLAHGLWQQGGIAFWSLAVLLIEFELTEARSKFATFCQGAALGMMLPCRLSAALFVVPFGTWVVLRTARRVPFLVLGALATFAPWAIFYASVYGTPLGPSTFQMAGAYWSTHVWDSLAGVLFSPARGLFVYQPWLLLAVGQVALLWGGKRQETFYPVPTCWRAFCLAVIVLQIALVSSWYCWWGGHCWGSRLLAEVVPLGALLCVSPVALLLRQRWGKALFATLAIGSFLIHASGVYRETCWEARVEVDKHPEAFWSWSQAPFLMSSYRQP